ncbi:MAG: selenocysteine-specific translation elongation factor [Anaerolineales bacterium]|nr:selenocysteine-specific translation elongation factor [Anaerolineales bacterium]
MRIIGTAGHVDHGKSTLVKALTGTNPDRLKEEQERQMTIDLGFASMDLSETLEVGFIDVPGHIDFIENMLMGVGGIDAALLVIAADEGVMPQTKEHLDILDLLHVRRVIVALTKIDLVDKEWLVLVIDDVENFLNHRGFEEVPVIPVSAKTDSGLDTLKQVMHDVLFEAPDRKDYDHPRLFIDRVFSLAGFGTIVTGTLIDGSLTKGQKVEILPSGSSARIRGLQSFNAERESSGPGNRLAINLSGVAVNELSRGMTIAAPHSYAPTSRIDVSFRMLPGLKIEIVHNMEVKLFHGSSQTQARIRLLGEEMLLPGQNGILQLELDQAIAARHGDRFILRRPSPSRTIGGGEILDPFPAKRHRRFDESRLSILKSLQQAGQEKIVEHIIREHGRISGADLSLYAMLPAELLSIQVEALVSENSIQVLNENNSNPNILDSIMIHATAYDQLLDRLQRILTVFHSQNPYLRGGTPEVIRSRLKLDQRTFQFLMQKAFNLGLIKEIAGKICLADFEISLGDKDRKKVNELMALIKSDPLRTPSVADILSEYGENILNYLKDQETIIQVSDQVIFAKEDYEKMSERLVKELQVRGAMKVTDVKELFPTSRKYILAFLEYLDGVGVTQRRDEERILK